MKNRIIVATSTGLSSGDYQVYNCEIVLSSTGRYDIGSRPTHIYFKNTSGMVVEFNFITRKELAEFQTDQTKFAGVQLANNEYFYQRDLIGVDILEPAPSFLLIKGISGSVSDNITIFCTNYI